MVKELKELIEDISSIDTSVDMDDIKMVSGLNNSIICDILSVRDFLIELNLPKTEKKDLPEAIHEAVKDPEDIAEYHGLKEEDPYIELMKLGLTQKTIDECYSIYNARTRLTKWKFHVVMKSCVFMHNLIVSYGEFTGKYVVDRAIITKTFSEFLKREDPETTYTPANIHDFITGKNFTSITSKFFTQETSYLITSNGKIDTNTPF